jgi:3-hydroxyacyl-[acyl-carrier-protein] dehydratase
MNDPIQLDILKILELLPHRYPFLLVDRVLECRAGDSIRALKNVTYNEPFFPGHFPVRPVMPGVMGIDKARFRKPVEPGDQLMLSAKLERSFKGIWRFSTVARVGEDEVAHADMMVAPEVRK